MLNIDTNTLIEKIKKMIANNEDIYISMSEYLSLSGYPEIRKQIKQYLKGREYHENSR